MEKQFITFHLGDGVYGINILGLREINYSRRFTVVPHSKEHMVGLLNLRGQIVTVIDLGIPLGYPPRDITENTSLLIMKTNQELSPIARQENIVTSDDQVGLLVDRIGDVVTCDVNEVHAVPAHVEQAAAKYLEGVLKLNDMLVGVINVPELLKYGLQDGK